MRCECAGLYDRRSESVDASYMWSLPDSVPTASVVPLKQKVEINEDDWGGGRLYLLHPCDRAYAVAHTSEVTQFCDGSVVSRPEVHACAKTDTENVCAAPVDEVEVEVVCKVWSVEYAVRRFAHCAGLSTG